MKMKIRTVKNPNSIWVSQGGSFPDIKFDDEPVKGGEVKQ